jgi:hypothetical protein
MYGNMGQQLKAGSASTSRNNLIVGNCQAMRQAVPGTPAGYNSRLSDFCRASDVAVALSVSDQYPTYWQDNTVLSSGDLAVQITCGSGGQTCTTGTPVLVFQNNVFIGFQISTANGYPSNWPTLGLYPTPIYFAGISETLTNPGSAFDHNSTYHARTNWACPNAAHGEIHAMCGDPGLTDETWHLYGYGDMSPVSNSPIIGAGIAIPGITTDFNGTKRPDPPAAGALEPGPNPMGEQIRLEPSLNPATTLDTISLVATVEHAAGPVPTGEVMFISGSRSLGSASLDNLGKAILDVAKLSAGSHGIMAVYSGDGNYPAWGSGITMLEVMAPSVTSLLASPGSITYGVPFSLTATVKGSASFMPSGTVTFLNGSGTLGKATVSASGVATLIIKSLPAGSHILKAQYSGSRNFLASTSSALTMSVKPQATTMTLAASPSSITYGAPFSLTARVRGSGSSVPSGTVTFLNGASLLGTANVSASGVATMIVKSLPAGSHTLKAQYSGTGNFVADTSPSLTLNVKAQATTVTLVSPATIAFGNALFLTAKVKGAVSAVAPGSVVFKNGSTVLGTIAVSPFGVAILSVKSMAVGSYALTARFSGSPGFLGSTSPVVRVRVRTLLAGEIEP